MVYFFTILKISHFPKNISYFDSNVELNIFVFLHHNHFAPGLKTLLLHYFAVYVKPNFCMKYRVLTLYVVGKFSSILRRNKKVCNMILSLQNISPSASLLYVTLTLGRVSRHILCTSSALSWCEFVCLSEEGRLLDKYFSIRSGVLTP